MELLLAPKKIKSNEIFKRREPQALFLILRIRQLAPETHREIEGGREGGNEGGREAEQLSLRKEEPIMSSLPRESTE